MKRKFTFLIAAAFMLLTMMATTGEMWGQSDYSTTYTSGVTLSTTGGTSASTCKVIVTGTTEYDGIKAGTSKVAGAMVINVPSGTKYLHIHAAAWNNENVTLSVTPNTNISPSSISLTADSGISGSGSTYTLGTAANASTNYYKVIAFTNALTANTNLTFTATSGKRFVIWGVNAEEDGGGSDPSISASDVDIAYDDEDGSIAYTLNNATGNVTAEVTSGNWITEIGTITATEVPFTCLANEGAAARTATITLSFTGASNKVVTITQAGNPNIVNNIEDITAAGTYTVKGTIVAMSTRGFVLGDGTGYVYYYYGNNFSTTYTIGNIVKLSGAVTASDSYKVFQFTSSATITAATESNYVAEDPTVISGADMDAQVASTAAVSLSNYIQYQGTLTVNNTYYNITSIDGATTAKGSISYPTSTDFASLNGKVVTVTGYYVGVSSNQYYNTMIGSIEEAVVPSITLEQYTYNLNADGGDAELHVTYTNMPATPQAVVIFYEANGTTPLTENPTWITASINANYNIAGHIDVNEGEARSAYFKVKGIDANDNEVYSNLITINQAAAGPNIEFNNTSMTLAAGGESDRKMGFDYSGLGDNPTFSINYYEQDGTTAATYDHSWLTATIEGKKVNISAVANTGAERKAYFKVYGENGNVNTESNLVTITQEVAPYATIEALFNAATTTATDVTVAFNNWVVSGVSTNGKNVFVTDGTNGFVINSNSNMSGTYSVGKILQGTITCSLKLQNGYAQLTNVSGLTITDGGSVTVAEIPMANLAGVNTGALVHYENLTCSVNGTKYYLTDGTTTLQVYNSLYAFGSLVNGKTYNITGIYQQYGETKEVLPRSTDDIVEIVAPSITVTPATVNVTAEGEDEGSLVIAYENLTITDPADFDIQYYDANNEPLNKDDNPDWMEASIIANSTQDGYVVSFSVDPNDGDARTAYFKVYALDDNTDEVYSNLITVSQEAYVAPTATIAVIPETVNVEASGEDEGSLVIAYENLTITDPADFDIQYYDANNEPLNKDDNPDWMEASIIANSTQDGYVVSFSVDPNDGAARTAYFKVYALDNQSELVYSNLVTVNQAAYVPPVQTENYELFSGDLVEGDYIIYYEGYAMKSKVVNSRLSYATVTPENNIISTANDSIVWHIAPSDSLGYWTIYSATVEKYAASTGAKNKAQLLATCTDNKALWSVTGNTTYEFVNRANDIAGVNKTLRNNGTNGFACYSTDTGGALKLYKKVNNTPSITLNQYTYNLNSDGGQAELPVVYNNMPANPQAVVIFYESDGVTPLTENPTWITAIINDNYNVDGNIQANTGEARSAYFKVKGIDADNNDVYSDLVTINQAAYALSIVFKTTELNIEVGGEQNRVLSFEYQGFGQNPAFEVRQYDATGQTQTTYEWLTTNITQGHKVNITVDANTGAARSGYFKVYGSDGTVNTESNLVTINQAAAAITYTVTFDVVGGTFVPNEHFATVSEQKEAGTYNLPSATKEGWEFAGWNDGTTTYEANAEYTVSAAVNFTAQWTVMTTATIAFGNNGTKINAASVTGNDSFGNTWTITTIGTSSFTQNDAFSQVGSSNSPATSITFTTTLAQETTFTAFSAKFGGNNNTAGTITLTVDDTTVGSGSLSGSSDVVVENTTTATGTVLTVTVTNIAKGVKCYYISYTISTGTDPMIVAQNSIDLSSTDTYGEFDYSIVNPATGVNLTASSTDEWISDINVTAEKVTFVTTPNTSTTDDREGTITLSYTGATDKVVTVTQSKVDFATIPFAYDGNGTGDLPTGLTATGLGTYSQSPAMKFDGTGDNLILKLNQAPVSLSYDIKGNSFSGGTFTVQTSANGTNYDDLATYTTLGDDVQSITHVDLDANVRYIKWIYTYKKTGNVALGNIHASENYDTYGDITINDLDLTSNPESLIIHGGSVVTLTGTVINDNPNNLIIEDGGQLIHENPVQATIQKNVTGYGSKSVAGWYLIASPVAGLEVDCATTGAYDFYAYDEVNTKWLNQKVAANNITNFTQGVGYLYANSVTTVIDYLGTLVGTNTEVTVENLSYACSDDNYKGVNLMGNPFSCNLVYGKLTLGGVNVQTYYTVEGGEELTAKSLDTNPIKPGQGFIIQASDAHQNLVFNPSSKDRSNEKVGYISIVAGNDKAQDNAFIQLGGGNTLRKMTISDNSSVVYVMNNGKDYAATRIDALEGSMPVCFKANKLGSYTITVEAKDIKTDYLHLIDNFTHEDIDLLLEPSYSFIASNGDNASRFTLVFRAEGSAGITNDIFAYQNGNDIIVNGEGELQVFDVMGRLMMTKRINNGETINISTTGVYIFKLNEKTQKIVIR